MTASRSWWALAEPPNAAARRRSGQPCGIEPPVQATHKTSPIDAPPDTPSRTAARTSRTRSTLAALAETESMPAGGASRLSTRSATSSRAGSTGSPASRRCARSARPSRRRSETSTRPMGPSNRSSIRSGVAVRGRAAISISVSRTATAGSSCSGNSSAVMDAGTPATDKARSTRARSSADRTRTAMSCHATRSCTWAERICSAMCASREECVGHDSTRTEPCIDGSWSRNSGVRWSRCASTGRVPSVRGARAARAASAITDP